MLCVALMVSSGFPKFCFKLSKLLQSLLKKTYFFTTKQLFALPLANHSLTPSLTRSDVDSYAEHHSC